MKVPGIGIGLLSILISTTFAAQPSSLGPVSAASEGSTINFEDAQRLLNSQTDCRLRTLESWHGGRNFDLFHVHKQLNGSRGYSYSSGGNLTYSLIQKLANDRTGKYNMLRGNSTIMKLIGRLLQDRSIMKEIRKDLYSNSTSNEARLQVALNACQSSNSNYQNYARLQALLNSQLGHFVVDLNIFMFGQLVRMWSRFWIQVRQYWTSLFYLTESQEYQGWLTAIQTGVGFISYTETYHAYSGELRFESYSMERRYARYQSSFQLSWANWFYMSSQQQSTLLLSNSILSGMNIFGYATLLAQTKGLNGSIGRMFNLRQRPKCGIPLPPRIKIKMRPPSIPKPSKGTDVFLVVAQALLSRDVSSFVDGAIYGKTIAHNGKLYRMDSYTGQLIKVADLTPSAIVNATLNPCSQPALASKIRQSKTIDSLLCVYENRKEGQTQLDDYYRNLRAWYSYGQVRGLAAPRPPSSVVQQCMAATGLDFQNGTNTEYYATGDYQWDGRIWKGWRSPAEEARWRWEASRSGNASGSLDWESYGSHTSSTSDSESAHSSDWTYGLDHSSSSASGSALWNWRAAFEGAWQRLLSGQSLDSTPQVRFDVEAKLERLCRLRKQAIIGSTEYSILRQMISDYANTSVVSQDNGGQGTAPAAGGETSAQASASALVKLLSNVRGMSDRPTSAPELPPPPIPVVNVVPPLAPPRPNYWPLGRYRPPCPPKYVPNYFAPLSFFRREAQSFHPAYYYTPYPVL